MKNFLKGISNFNLTMSVSLMGATFFGIILGVGLFLGFQKFSHRQVATLQSELKGPC